MAFPHFAQDFSPASSFFDKRQEECLKCPNEAPPCPKCNADQVCSQTLGDCRNCPQAFCVAASTSGSIPANTGQSDSGPNIGAIVGGVIGGVTFIAVAVFCIWKFWLKGRRHEVEIEEEWEDDYPAEKSNASVFTREARSRASTHTVASMASTVLTRASNIIQIAYIPGVTNRGGSDPNMLVPPVPPIPSAAGSDAGSTNSRAFEDGFMFMPNDIRDSTWSGMSDLSSDRRPGSIAPSLARTSMASTIYRDSAVINQMPATQVIGGKAAMVSVISKGSTPGSTPPVPSVDFAKHGGNAVKPVLVKMPGSSGASSGGGGGSATSSLRTMKPVALNIIRKKDSGKNGGGDTASLASSQGSGTAASGSRASKRMTANSLAPSEMSVDTHRRARQSGMTHRSSHVTTYSEDDEDEDADEHERSRKSLLERESRLERGKSPFGDEAKAGTPPPADRLTVGVSDETMERGRSPFEDPPEPSPTGSKAGSVKKV